MPKRKRVPGKRNQVKRSLNFSPGTQQGIQTWFGIMGMLLSGITAVCEEQPTGPQIEQTEDTHAEIISSTIKKESNE